MKNATPSSATTFLTEKENHLRYIFNKVKEHDALQKHLLATLDAGMKDYVCVGNIANQILTLLTPNSAIATQLRYQAVEILKKLHQQAKHLAYLKKIEVKVSPDFYQTTISRWQEKPAHVMEKLSPQTASVLTETAAGIADPLIKKILERIATRVKDP